MSEELRLIHTSLSEIRETMVRKDDIKTLVTTIVAEMKAEIKQEIIAEVKETLTKEIRL
jgi:hypothetical protein